MKKLSCPENVTCVTPTCHNVIEKCEGHNIIEKLSCPVNETLVTPPGHNIMEKSSNPENQTCVTPPWSPYHGKVLGSQHHRKVKLP